MSCRPKAFTGGYQQVQRALQPLRTARRWATRATVRFETGPGEQAQVDFGQLRVWIADVATPVHFFVFTLGFSRRAIVYVYRNERLDTLLDGHERALRHFGGVPLSCLYDNPRTITLGRAAGLVLWHPRVEDFARYYGFTPRACQPYRARTKGKVESGVKYVKRNALAGRRFPHWAALEAWLEEWAATVADVRVHGTTHERPIDRFGRETLTPLGRQPPYHYEATRRRIVAADALVAIAAGRYSVPVRYVGQTVDVRETATPYVIVVGDTPIAQHVKASRHAVVMEPSPLSGLRSPRPSTSSSPGTLPDPTDFRRWSCRSMLPSKPDVPSRTARAVCACRPRARRSVPGNGSSGRPRPATPLARVAARRSTSPMTSIASWLRRSTRPIAPGSSLTLAWSSVSGTGSRDRSIRASACAI